eukprot:g6273.t1
MRDNGARAKPSPVFPKPVYATAEVTNEPGVGFLLASQKSFRQFFCPEDSHCVATQFSGSVTKTYEVVEHDDAEDQHELCSVIFGGKLLYYNPSHPLALKTSRIAVLQLEAQWQRCALGELTGEDPVKEVASLQLLHTSGGHPGVEELYEAMQDDTTLYKISAWYSGGELFDLSPLPEQTAKPVFAQILDALKFVHSQGVCHRDISLENILLDTSSSMPTATKRGCSSRSSSVSSVGSCISVGSDFTDEADEERAGGFHHAADGRCCLDSPGRSCSSPSDGSVDAGRLEAAGEWIGTPRLCDFGMSVRIPTTPTGERALVTPQGRCGKSTCVAPEVFYDQVFDAHAIDTWSVGTTLFMALLGVQPWEEIGDFKFQAIAEGKNLDVVLQGWNLRDSISDEALDLLQAMLTADPEERLSDIESILAHPWFQGSTSTSASNK